MKTAVLMGSVSRAGGGLFDAERRLHQTLAVVPGMEVRVFGLEDTHTDTDLGCWHPIYPNVFRSKGCGAWAYAPEYMEAIFRSCPDICYSAGLWQWPSFVALRWTRQFQKPLLVAPHGMLDSWALAQSCWKKRIAGLLFQNAQLRVATCLRALCDSEADSIHAYGINNPVCVIPNGIDIPEVSGQWSMVSGLKAEGRKVLLYLGRIHPKKGLVNLLKAWKTVVNGQRLTISGQPQWILAIAGWEQGGHEVELKRLTAELGIPWEDVRDQGLEVRGQKVAVSGQYSVVFLGPQFGEAKTACYWDCDAFILPSFSEGLPMVVLEAWAHGKPVLMTSECNLPEGFAVEAAIRMEPGVESIERGLLEMFEMSGAERQAMGARGRKLVAEKFSWSQIATGMKSVYEWILGGGPKPDCVTKG